MGPWGHGIHSFQAWNINFAYFVKRLAEMINTIETGIGIGLFPIIGIGIGIGFKQTLLIGIGIGIGKFLFWLIGFGIGIGKF